MICLAMDERHRDQEHGDEILPIRVCDKNPCREFASHPYVQLVRPSRKCPDFENYDDGLY